MAVPVNEALALSRGGAPGREAPVGRPGTAPPGAGVPCPTLPGACANDGSETSSEHAATRATDTRMVASLNDPTTRMFYIPPKQRYLISRNSSMPYFDPSRPSPDSLTPPNGATSVEIRPVLMPTIPDSSASATRQTRPISRP